MSSIFKPIMRQALNFNASYSSQCIFGGDFIVLKNLEESKKMNTLVRSSLLQTKKAGKAGTKSGKNKGKKPAAGDPRPRARTKVLKTRPGTVKPKLRRTLAAPRRRRTQPRRKKRMTHVSQ